MKQFLKPFKRVTRIIAGEKSPVLVVNVEVILRFPETISMFYTTPLGDAKITFFDDGSWVANFATGGSWTKGRKEKDYHWEFLENGTLALSFGLTHIAFVTDKNTYHVVVDWLKRHRIKMW